MAEQMCVDSEPNLIDLRPSHRAACHVAARDRELLEESLR